MDAIWFWKSDEEGKTRGKLCNGLVLNQLDRLGRCILMEGYMMNVLLAQYLSKGDSDAPPTDALSHHEPHTPWTVCVCVMYLI